MRYQHENLVVQNLRVDFKVFGDALVQNGAPGFYIQPHFGRVVADSVAPRMENYAQFELRLICLFSRLLVYLLVDYLGGKICLLLEILTVLYKL